MQQSKDNPLGMKAMKRTPAKPHWAFGSNDGKRSSSWERSCDAFEAMDEQGGGWKHTVVLAREPVLLIASAIYYT